MGGEYKKNFEIVLLLYLNSMSYKTKSEMLYFSLIKLCNLHIPDDICNGFNGLGVLQSIVLYMRTYDIRTYCLKPNQGFI